MPPIGPAPGPPPVPQQPVIRNSIKYSDITPRRPLSEDDCRKKLTTYQMFNIRKHADGNTWAKAEFIRDYLPSEDCKKQIKRINEAGPSVAERKAKLYPNQQGQVTKLLDDSINNERDSNFEWSLAQLEREERKIKGGKKETTTITVYLKREPVQDIGCLALFTAIDRAQNERNEQLLRPPQPPPGHPGAGGPGAGAGGGGGDPQIIRLPDGHGGPIPHGPHDDSSTESDYDSDDTRTTRSSTTQPSTVSSSSSRHHRRSGHRRRSHSRHRHRQHYITDREHRRIESPERPNPNDREPRVYVPDVPRHDAIAAAYQAGRVAADAERFGLIDRHGAADRYSQRLDLERPLVIHPAPRLEDRFDDRVAAQSFRDEPDRYYPRGEHFLRRRRNVEELYERPLRVERFHEEPFYREIPIRYRYAPSHDSW